MSSRTQWNPWLLLILLGLYVLAFFVPLPAADAAGWAPWLRGALIAVFAGAMVVGFMASLVRGTLTWRAILVMAVIVLCGVFLYLPGVYDPSIKLKPGRDLAGGTALIYEVEVPADQDAKRVVEQTIAVLKKRVDPSGVRNLTWRPLGSNRFEIQMALASPETARRRDLYLKLRHDLLASNLSASHLEVNLRAPAAQRGATLDSLARGNPDLRKKLSALAEAFDATESVRGPYEQAQNELRKAQATLRSLPQDAPAEQATELRKHVESLQKELTARARPFVDAQNQYDLARTQALATNLEVSELEQALAQSDKTQRLSKRELEEAGGKEAAPPRQQALERLVAKHADRAAQLRELFTAYADYEKLKGALDDPNDLIAMMRGSGVLEFRIAPPAGTVADEGIYRDQLHKSGPRVTGEGAYAWFAIDDIQEWVDDAVQSAVSSRRAGVTAQQRRDLREQIERQVQEKPQEFFANRGLIGDQYAGKPYILLGNSDANSITQRQGAWRLVVANRAQDDRGFPNVAFTLDSAGGQLMRALTGAHLKQPMAIALDGKVISTPTIQDTIGEHGQITGGASGFSERELAYLINTLNAGSLSARVSESPISIVTVGPELGQDNLRHGLEAGILAFVLVAIFMIVYYFFWGLIAFLALVANILIILGIMAMMQATFTLPGIAGVVLTIGMAVDANVLIFERIREELERKAELHTAIRLGFEKALAAILDSNLTTIITCLVLWYTASSEVRGFAITLGVGIAANIFTAVFCSRVLLNMYVDIVQPKRLLMLPMAVPAVRRLLSPNVDWYGKRYWFYGLTVALTLAGIVALIGRGRDILDIEFRSGTQVSFELAGQQTMHIDEVRKRLASAADPLKADLARQVEQASGRLAAEPQNTELAEHLADLQQRLAQADELARATVVTLGQTRSSLANEFSVATLVENPGDVSNAIKSAFRDKLDVQLPLTFAGIQAPISDAPVFPVVEPRLGDNISRPGRPDRVEEYVGGVAIVLQDLDPPASVQDVTRRIARMRQQPAYESSLDLRKFTVIPLESAPAPGTGAAPDAAASTAPAGTALVTAEPLYRSVVVLVRDENTNYVKNPDAFRDAQGLAASEWALVRDALQRDTSLGSVSNFSSQISGTMQQQAIAAIVLSWLAMLIYIWFRFGNLRYGMGAIVALVHDVVITVGLFAAASYLAGTPVGDALGFTDFRINLAVIAAVLTLIGYSVNDTIVVFDRIRENRGRLAFATPAIINDSVNQTISRTLLTGTTTIGAALILYIMGGAAIHGFAFIIFVGVIVGTYSTVAIASPVLLLGIREPQAVGHHPPQTAPAKA